MPQIETVDVEGAVRAYLLAYPGLCGEGNPVLNGFILGKARSPSRGAIGELEAITPRTLDDATDTARVALHLKAVGSEEGARLVAGLAARRTVEAILALAGLPAVVQTKGGEWVRLLVAADSAGPTFGGDVGGEVTYLVDATFMCQPGVAP